ncbi:AraC family transcriptional regulator [Hoeflea sp. TYP-13]|uniref:AraC family transcriptional regulator n=1 Tax=Hoeflea sp. TYP-13 TaxID=3230023 RepID=UPI0034C65711
MTPLSQYALFRTSDPDHARELVAQKFCSHRLETIGAHRIFDACQHSVRGAMLSINYIRYGATVLIDPGELQDFYLIQLPINGDAQIANGNVVFDSNASNGSVLNPDRKTQMIWQAGCEQLIIYIDREAMTSFAERMIGRSLSKPLVFDPHIVLERQDTLCWRHKVAAFYAAADDGRLFCSAATLQQRMLEEELMAEFLQIQPSNISQFCRASQPSLAPGYVSRARRYIIENADRPIALGDIAAAADVSVRALQYEFMKVLSQTPMQVLRRERLMRIRQELASGHCDNTVARVAAKWGMPHFGRFSRYYSSEFGELPSTTRQAANEVRQ